MKLALESCRRKPLFIVDHTPWYACAFEWLDVDWVPLTFSIRNYIERWYRTFKERTKRFYHNFGVREGNKAIKRVERFVHLFAFLYKSHEAS